MTRGEATTITAAAVLTALCACGGRPASTSGDGPLARGEGSAYAVSKNTLYVCGLLAAGTDAAVGDLRLSGGTPISVTDVATTPDGNMYAVSFARLYQVDGSTAVASPIGGPGLLSGVNALASDSSGALYGASVTGGFYSIDRITGIATLIGAFGNGLISSGDLVFDPDGVLWAAVRAPSASTDTLATIDVATGLATPRHGKLPRDTWGLVVSDGVLFGLSSFDSGLYAIDRDTGEVTRVRSLSFVPYGSTM